MATAWVAERIALLTTVIKGLARAQECIDRALDLGTVSEQTRNALYAQHTALAERIVQTVNELLSLTSGV